MGQSPIQFVITQALPLLTPLNLLEVLTPVPPTVRAVIKGEEGHRNFELSQPQSTPFCRFRSRDYDLFRIHIHVKTEHTIKNRPPSQLEIHLVCIPHGGQETDPKVVIGILIDEDDNADSHKGIEALGKVYGDSIRGIKKGGSQSEEVVPVAALFPDDGKDLVNWYHYEGSLTSFPYSEDVSWFVFKNISSATKENISVFTSLVDQDARELQPLERRLVVRSFVDENKTSPSTVQSESEASTKSDTQKNIVSHRQSRGVKNPRTGKFSGP